mmetsp:Transcript_99574/g.171446  ORF Transcript_99574/g.171446 Transcript_99574/m.171446 type:complete len:312 (-) Transcript_99574:554-1489(-)
MGQDVAQCPAQAHTGLQGVRRPLQDRDNPAGQGAALRLQNMHHQPPRGRAAEDGCTAVQGVHGGQQGGLKLAQEPFCGVWGLGFRVGRTEREALDRHLHCHDRHLWLLAVCLQGLCDQWAKRGTVQAETVRMATGRSTHDSGHALKDCEGGRGGQEVGKEGAGEAVGAGNGGPQPRDVRSGGQGLGVCHKPVGVGAHMPEGPDYVGHKLFVQLPILRSAPGLAVPSLALAAVSLEQLFEGDAGDGCCRPAGPRGAVLPSEGYPNSVKAVLSEEVPAGAEIRFHELCNPTESRLKGCGGVVTLHVEHKEHHL